MAMTSETLEILLKKTLLDASVIIEDLAGDGDHYRATVICESFRGKSKIQQHKMVYAAFQGKMGLDLHALSLNTQVPADLSSKE